MRPSGLDWALFVGSLVAFLGAALIGVRRDLSSLAPDLLAGVLGSVGVFFVRSGLEDVSLRGSLRTAAALNIAILVASRGRPHNLFDDDQLKARTLRRMSKAERAKFEDDARNTAVT